MSKSIIDILLTHKIFFKLDTDYRYKESKIIQKIKLPEISSSIGKHIN